MEGSRKFLEKKRQVHNLKISDRLYDSRVFFKNIFLVCVTKISNKVFGHEFLFCGAELSSFQAEWTELARRRLGLPQVSVSERLLFEFSLELSINLS